MIAVCYLILALFDAWYTSYRLPPTGLTAEWNPTIRFLARMLGLRTGIYVGVLLPTLLILSLGTLFPSTLIFLLGCRTTLATFQLKTYYDLKNATNRTAETGIS